MSDAPDSNRDIAERVAAALPGLIALSHDVHADAEVAFEEVVSSQRVASALAGAGYTVEMGVAGLPTAFVAELGTGGLVVGLCAEYDALPGLGHACGHNIIAASAVGAALALAPLADELDLTVRVLGTPAEEGGSGKIYMLERGAFDGLHAAMMVHPAPYDAPHVEALAAQSFVVEYEGRAAHASVSPQEGVNAADALTVGQVAVGLLRQHIRTTDRIHGIVTFGGAAANIIPDRASGTWYARARTLQELDTLIEKVQRCFEAGALATGATITITEPHPRRSEMRDDDSLSDIYQRVVGELGRDFEVFEQRGPIVGSTDMANVSLAIPSIHPMIGIESGGAPLHSVGFAAAAVSTSADLAIRDGSIGLAATVVGLATETAVRNRLATQPFSSK